ncbi:MAG: 6-bladed beta-propeller [Bacteroidales bacterium]|nr:6-bladed beta-propeller [Bacteroidales bacterium]
MKISGYLLIVFLISSCKSSDNEVIQIDLDKTSGTEITLASIADEISYVPLDNNYPMSIYFQRTEIIDDMIYLNEKDNGMFAVDNSGKMVRRYGNRGCGPGEYVLGFRYAIDRDGGVLYLLDKKKILKFSLDGPYLGDISLEKYPGGFSEIRFRDSEIICIRVYSYGEAVYDWIVI